MRTTPLLAAILAAACGSATAPIPVLRVHAEAANLPVGARVTFTARNTSNGTAFLARCGDRAMTAIDRWQRGVWHQYSGDLCLAIFPMVPQTLVPGGEYKGATVIREPGRYRLRLGVGLTPGSVEWTAVSNPIDVQ